MSELIFSWGVFPLLAALLAGWMLFSALAGIRMVPRKAVEAWRDELPPLFRALRPLIAAIVERYPGSAEQHKKVRGKLQAAGVDYMILPEEFIALRFIGSLIGALFALMLWSWLDQPGQGAVMGCLGVVALGYFYPDIWLNDTIKARHLLFGKQFPFFLDLITLSLRAGLTFPSAISQSLPKLPPGPVRVEFERVVRETRTGVSRRDALIAMAKRNQLVSLTNFVAAVNQAEETGAVLGEVLLAQSRQRRTERFLHAEKLAGQAPVKMLLPLMALLFPITFVIIAFPIAMKFLDSPAATVFK